MPQSPSSIAENARLQALRSAPVGSWVALSQDDSRLLATGGDFAEASRKLAALGEEDAYILRIPPRSGLFAF